MVKRKKYVSYASTVKNEKLPGKHLPVCLHFFLFLYWKSSLCNTQYSIFSQLTTDFFYFDKLKSTKENTNIYIYSKFKTEYEMNNYILNINYEDRKLLCKMCVSDHFLEIERGRYTRIKKENRICKFCDLKEVEDEFHFFFKCKNNHTLRNILYKDINGICPKINEYDRAKKNYN